MRCARRDSLAPRAGNYRGWRPTQAPAASGGHRVGARGEFCARACGSAPRSRHRPRPERSLRDEPGIPRLFQDAEETAPDAAVAQRSEAHARAPSSPPPRSTCDGRTLWRPPHGCFSLISTFTSPTGATRCRRRPPWALGLPCGQPSNWRRHAASYAHFACDRGSGRCRTWPRRASIDPKQPWGRAKPDDGFRRRPRRRQAAAP